MKNTGNPWFVMIHKVDVFENIENILKNCIFSKMHNYKYWM